MNRITISITIEVPEGSQISVGTSEQAQGEYVPPFADELIPLPENAIPVRGDVVMQPTAFRAPTLAAQISGCPVHLKPWKLVPAGVSKRTGQGYNAFLACPERGCDQRPAA